MIVYLWGISRKLYELCRPNLVFELSGVIRSAECVGTNWKSYLGSCYLRYLDDCTPHLAQVWYLKFL